MNKRDNDTSRSAILGKVGALLRQAKAMLELRRSHRDCKPGKAGCSLHGLR